MVLKDDWATGDTYTADAANEVATQVNANTADIANKADASAIPDELTDLDTTVTGAELDAIKSKVDGIESGADVTDATNVAAAGAFMKSSDDLDDISEGATNKHFTSSEKTKLSGIEEGAQANTVESLTDLGVTATASELNILDGATLSTTELNYVDGVTSPIQTQLNAKYAPGGTDVALGDGGTGASLSDPNADRIMFWDDSAGAVTWLAPNTGLAISGTNLNVSNVPTSAIGTGKVEGSSNGTPTSLTLWIGSQAQYDAIGSKSSTTVYVVTA